MTAAPMLLVATSNLENNSLDTVGELLHREDVVLGLGDGGRALRDDLRRQLLDVLPGALGTRIGGPDGFTVPEAVRETHLRAGPHRRAGGSRPQSVSDTRADLNVIDHARTGALHKPVITYDLPAGWGAAWTRTADGYVATIVFRRSESPKTAFPTAARPGQVGPRAASSAPVPAR